MFVLKIQIANGICELWICQLSRSLYVTCFPFSSIKQTLCTIIRFWRNTTSRALKRTRLRKAQQKKKTISASIMPLALFFVQFQCSAEMKCCIRWEFATKSDTACLCFALGCLCWFGANCFFSLSSLSHLGTQSFFSLQHGSRDIHFWCGLCVSVFFTMAFNSKFV